MRHILNKDVERQQELLMIMFKDDHWKATNDISEALDCNIKTLRQDIDYLTNEYSDVITCEYSKNLGYKFHVQNGHSIQEIFLDWIKHSLFFSIISDVFLQKNKDDDDYFYNTYFISETTLKRQVALINYHLKDLGMSLSLSKMTFKVKDEFVARMFFGNREMEKRSIYDWSQEQVENQALAFLVIDRLQEHFKIELTILQKNMMAYFVLSSVIRSAGKFYMNYDEESPLMKDEQMQNKLYDMTNPETNTPYLISRVQVNDTLLFLEELFLEIKEQYESDTAYNVGIEVMEMLASKMEAPVEVFEKELVIKDIAYCLFTRKRYPYKASYINHRGFFNSHAIMLKYPIFYRSVQETFAELPKKYQFMSVYSLELINSLFRYWKASEYDYITKVNQVSLYISTTLNENQAKMIQYIYEKAFNNKIEVVGYEFEKNNFNRDEDNPLIQTSDLVVCNHLFYSELDNVMVVDDIVDDATLYHMNSRLDDIRKLKTK